MAVGKWNKTFYIIGRTTYSKMKNTNAFEDCQILLGKIDLPDNYKHSLIFNLLAVKYGIENAFSWDAPGFPDDPDWEKYDFTIADTDKSMWLKQLTDITESLGLSMDLLEMSTAKKFDFETMLDENPVPATMDDVMDPRPDEQKLGNISNSKLEEIEHYFSADKHKMFWISTEEHLSEIRKKSKSMKEPDVKEYCGHPSCCIHWFIQRDTEILGDSITEFYGTTFDFSEETFKHFILHNFWNHDNFNHQKRMAKLNNRADATKKKFPFVPYPACDKCMEDSQSPSEKLNNDYEEFSKSLSPPVYSYLKKHGFIRSFT